MSESSWYEPPPGRSRHHVRRRDLVEFAIAVLLLLGLTGLLLLGACDRTDPPRPAASPSP
ncbi:hypothetical protein GCM10020358_76540 [Amorphoplanes nipponensis]|uniref:Uncharacterized protein n=1 Tax=Actinoplanes nipponensis TaxID=135950 RepID=A0A919MUC3_9ACTN|nr:hypothetical protein [Actinoplanes nipponensis]GIE49985.1 hypothetical protein Ani05nite_35190 [Actinoplanes nipponensis]